MPGHNEVPSYPASDGLTRIGREELFMATAKLFALRSTCNRGKVGAVITQDKRIISHGYNGAPSGLPHCTDVGCDTLSVWVAVDDEDGVAGGVAAERQELGCQRAIHAEANAIAWAARAGIPTNGAAMYSTHEPCRKCSELIIQAGIVAVTWAKPYRLGAQSLLDEAHVQCSGPLEC